MTNISVSNEKSANPSSLPRLAAAFFGSLEKDERGRKLLGEQDYRIEFDLLDSAPFYVAIKGGNVTVHEEVATPRRYDCNDIIHFQLQSKTLQRLFDGNIRYTDALVPSNQDGKDAMVLLECTLFKWSVLNWVGRMFRGAQMRGKGI